MVHDDEAVGPDGLQVCFDDERVVSDAGIVLVATLAKRLGIEALAVDRVRLRRDRPGAANAGRKVMALLFAMVLGADSIDDTDAWTVLAAIAHNLLRWTQLIGLPDTPVRAARTLRRWLINIPGRLTTHARGWTLHLPARWPWHGDYTRALNRIRALPHPA